MATKPEIEQYSEEELAAAGLTADEMAALKDEGDSGVEPTKDSDDDGDHNNLPDRVDDRSMPHDAQTVTEEPPVTESVDEVDPKKEAKADDAADEIPTAADDETPERDRTPQMAVPEVKDWAALKADLSHRYEEGEITNAQFTTELATIVKEETTAELRLSFNKEMAENTWKEQQNEFLDEHEEYKKSPIAYQALNAAVHEVSIDPKNASLTGSKILAKAHEAVQAAFGRKVTDVPPQKTPAAPPPRKPDLKSVPTTLAHVPAAAGEGIGEDRFSEIDKLEGLAQERAIAKLSEADQDAYLRQANG